MKHLFIATLAPIAVGILAASTNAPLQPKAQLLASLPNASAVSAQITPGEAAACIAILSSASITSPSGEEATLTEAQKAALCAFQPFVNALERAACGQEPGTFTFTFRGFTVTATLTAEEQQALCAAA